jgi:hypothetical protein
VFVTVTFSEYAPAVDGIPVHVGCVGIGTVRVPPAGIVGVPKAPTCPSPRVSITRQGVSGTNSSGVGDTTIRGWRALRKPGIAAAAASCSAAAASAGGVHAGGASQFGMETSVFRTGLAFGAAA